MIELDAATLLVGWAAGGWFFLWVTTRRREVGLGYGWLMRGIFLALAAAALALGLLQASIWSDSPAATGRDLATMGLIGSGAVALLQSVRLRSAGVAGQRAEAQRRSARVAEMSGIDRREPRYDADAPEFSPRLDLLAALLGLAAAILGAMAADGPAALAVARTVVGALFIGAVTDAMLLGHWYLVQPGLARGPLLQMVRVSGLLWLPETVVLLCLRAWSRC